MDDMTGAAAMPNRPGPSSPDKRRQRRAQTPDNLAEAVVSQRHSERSYHLPNHRRAQVARMAEFFARLYNDTGLKSEQIRDSIVLKYARLYREEGLPETEAMRLASSTAPGIAFIKRLASPAQMLSQSDVGHWRLEDVLDVCGSDIATMAAAAGFDATERERSVEHARRVQAFTRRFNMLGMLGGEQDQDWILQDMTRLVERRQAEAKARAAGREQIRNALGLPTTQPGEPDVP